MSINNYYSSTVLRKHFIILYFKSSICLLSSRSDLIANIYFIIKNRFEKKIVLWIRQKLTWMPKVENECAIFFKKNILPSYFEKLHRALENCKDPELFDLINWHSPCEQAPAELIFSAANGNKFPNHQFLCTTFNVSESGMCSCYRTFLRFHFHQNRCET